MIALGAVVGAMVTLFLCPPLIRALEWRAVLDTPVERSSHLSTTPRGGGIAPALGACIASLVVSASSSTTILLVASTAFAFGALGLADDLLDVSARWRLLVQVVISASVVAPLVSGIASGIPAAGVVLIGWLWLAAYVNAFNFMDGINGISVAQVVVAGAAWSAVGAWRGELVLAAGGAVVAAVALAFLPFNYPHAKVFLGDVGSYFFGGWLAAMVLLTLGRGLTPEMAVAPVLLYVCDTGTTLVRRAARRTPLLQPHREHTYQRLVIGGWSHGRTTGFVAIVLACSSVLGALTLVGDIVLRVAADAALVLLMVGYLASPRWQRGRSRSLASGLLGRGRR